MKTARDFWNKGNGHQPPTLLYLQAKFQIPTFVVPDISLDEQHAIYIASQLANHPRSQSST